MSQFIANRAQLVSVLSVLVKLVDRKLRKPVLECVRIDAHADHITLTTTDLQTCATVQLHTVQVERLGSCLMPARDLLKLLQSIKCDTVQIEPGRIAWDGVATLPAFDLADFPPLASLGIDARTHEHTHTHEYPARRVHDAIASVIGSAAREATRYAFNGVLLEHHAAGMRAVATDGRRLTVAGVDIAPDARTDAPRVKQMILNTRALKSVILPALKSTDAAEPVRFAWSDETCVRIIAGDWTIATQPIEGQFPHFLDVIPRESETIVETTTDDLAAIVAQGAASCDVESRGVRIDIVGASETGSQHGVRVSSRNATGGQSSAVLYMRQKVSGPSLVIGVNPDFLGDVLKRAKRAPITIGFTAPHRPLRIDTPSARTIDVVMPVNLDIARNTPEAVATLNAPNATAPAPVASEPAAVTVAPTPAPHDRALNAMINALPAQQTPPTPASEPETVITPAPVVEVKSAPAPVAPRRLAPAPVPQQDSEFVTLIDAQPSRDVFASLVARYGPAIDAVCGNLGARQITAGIEIRRAGSPPPDEAPFIALVECLARYAVDCPAPVPARESMADGSPYRRSTWAASLLTELFYRIGWTRGQARTLYRPRGMRPNTLRGLKRELMRRALACKDAPQPVAV